MRAFKRLPIRRGLVALTAVPLVLAACGGDDDQATEPPADLETESGAHGGGAVMLTQVFAGATRIDGSTFDASGLAGSDAVIWFWAPWCTSCRGEAPEVAEVAQRFEGQVTLIGVPGRGELDAMLDFVDDTGTSAMTHVADLDGAIWSEFGVYGQPAYAFVDDSGEIEVFVGGLGGDALAERIDELIAT